MASIAHAVQDDTTLAWKLAKGDTLTVQFDQTQTVLTRIDVRDRTLESEITLVVDWNVIDVAGDGNVSIEQTIQRIRIKTGAPGAALKKVVDLDTQSDARLRGVSRDVMKQIKTLIGLKFEVVMTPTGEIVSVAPDAAVATAVAALPETSALRRIFSAASMEKLVTDSAFVLPQKPVGKGATWNQESSITIDANDGRKLPFKRTVKSTLASIDDQTANVDVEITLAQETVTAAASGNELTSPLELTGFTGSGTMTFDLETGTITSSRIKSETKTRVIYRKDQVKTTTNLTNTMTVTRK